MVAPENYTINADSPDSDAQLLRILREVLKNLERPIHASIATADGSLFVFRQTDAGRELEQVYTSPGATSGQLRTPLRVFCADKNGATLQINIYAEKG